MPRVARRMHIRENNAQCATSESETRMSADDEDNVLAIMMCPANLRVYQRQHTIRSPIAIGHLSLMFTNISYTARIELTDC